MHQPQQSSNSSMTSLQSYNTYFSITGVNRYQSVVTKLEKNNAIGNETRWGLTYLSTVTQWRLMPWLQLRSDYTIRLRRIARACFQFDASKIMNLSIFRRSRIVVVSQSNRINKGALDIRTYSSNIQSSLIYATLWLVFLAYAGTIFPSMAKFSSIRVCFGLRWRAFSRRRSSNTVNTSLRYLVNFTVTVHNII